MFLLSLGATYQRCSVSPKAGRSTYIRTGVHKIMTRFDHNTSTAVEKIRGQSILAPCRYFRYLFWPRQFPDRVSPLTRFPPIILPDYGRFSPLGEMPFVTFETCMQGEAEVPYHADPCASSIFSSWGCRGMATLWVLPLPRAYRRGP